MAHTCRGTINLSTAHIDTEDSCGILLTSGARSYHLKAGSEVDRQQWITALELAKAKAVRVMNTHSGSEHLGQRVCIWWCHEWRKWELQAAGGQWWPGDPGQPGSIWKVKVRACSVYRQQ